MNTRTNTFRRRLGTLALVLALGVLPGCVAAALGAGAVGLIYIHGEHGLVVSAAPVQAVAVAKTAVEDHGFVYISSDADELSGQVIARTKDDTRVLVTAERLSDGSSRVWVRIGTFGQENLSQELLYAIRDRIGGVPEGVGPQQATAKN